MSSHIHSLVLSTADWDRPLWTNKQYVARALSALGRVSYLNSLGLRRPEPSGDDLVRLLRRIVGRPGGMRREVPVGIETISPWVIPWHRRSAVSWPLNRASLRLTLRNWRRDAPGRRLLWTFSPVTYGLERDADAVVYHCVDLLEHLHGVDPVTIREAESALARVPGIVAVASSRCIAEHLDSRGFPEVLLWENVADVETIAARADESERRPGHIVFAGNLTPQKVDFALLRSVVDSDPAIRLHLAGPRADGGGEIPDLHWFERHSRVELHGTLAPPTLAQLLGECTVGLVPYRRSPYTDGVFPMKVYEYLAAGLAVVSTDLPSLAGAAGIAAHSEPEAFIRDVIAGAPGASESTLRDRASIAARNSWTARNDQIVALARTRLPH